MTTREFLSRIPTFGLAEGGFARRVALARQAREDEEEYGKPTPRRLLGELDVLKEPARRITRRLNIPKATNPQTVLVLPGFASGAGRMRYFAQQLERAGHRTKRWGLGRNWGASEETFAHMEKRLLDLHKRSGKKVVLLGWSLGGVFGRELAKRHPEAVTKVITMGSPFSGSPRANNVWRIYQFITGHPVDQPPVEAEIATKPPVETVAFWSANDGVIAPRCAAGLPEERDRAIALRCTHIGYTYAPETIFAVLSELERV
ncbi:MAG: alpha/beta fold hydrolase [Erythrobacter sp.]